MNFCCSASKLQCDLKTQPPRTIHTHEEELCPWIFVFKMSFIILLCAFFLAVSLFVLCTQFEWYLMWQPNNSIALHRKLIFLVWNDFSPKIWSCVLCGWAKGQLLFLNSILTQCSFVTIFLFIVLQNETKLYSEACTLHSWWAHEPSLFYNDLHGVLTTCQNACNER